MRGRGRGTPRVLCAAALPFLRNSTGDHRFMDTFNDKSLNCADCGQEFVFSKNEQAFYAERGFTNEPKRCKNCRDKRKTARDGNGGGGGPRPPQAGRARGKCPRRAPEAI